MTKKEWIILTASTNVLIALDNIFKRNSTRLTPIFRSNGSANAAGDSLEYFVKDMFCTGASQYQYDHEKEQIYKKYLSWTGDSSHFPDFIVKGGVGVEPKKLDNKSTASLSLNSSYPKDYIEPTTQNVPTEKTKGYSETGWHKKPIIYVAGNLNKEKGPNENKLFSLWMVYGNTMIANNTKYLSLIGEIRGAIKSNTDATLVNSKELARAKGIDYLKYTNLRVRGMYELEHPAKVFEKYIRDISLPDNKSHVFVVMLVSEYKKIKEDMGDQWEQLNSDLQSFINKGVLTRKKIEIDDPNGTGNKLDAYIFAGYTD